MLIYQFMSVLNKGDMGHIQSELQHWCLPTIFGVVI